MINITEDIVFQTVEPELLHRACLDALNATITLCRDTFDPNNVHLYDTPTASSKCTYKELAFPHFMNMEQVFDKRWIESMFSCAKAEHADMNAAAITRVMGHRSILTDTLAKGCITAFRAVLLHLWSRKHILLPMSFPLPRRVLNNKRVEFATDFYTDVLAFFRSPFCGVALDQPDIIRHMRGTSADNLNWYGYKPVLGSNWHSPSDVTIEDLNTLNIYLATQRRRKKDIAPKIYSISAHSIAEPLLSAFPGSVCFSASEITTFPVNYVTPEMLQREAEATDDPAFPEQKKTWMEAEQLFIKSKRKAKIKNIRSIEHSVGILNKYIFEELPKAGISPPLPTEFTDKYISAEPGTPSAIDFLGTKAIVNTIRQMFEFFEDQSHRHAFLENFRNPITKMDIPIGRYRRVTAKSVFKLSIFRNFHAFIGAIQLLTCKLFHLLHANAHNPDFGKRFLKEMKTGVIDIANWCECPTVEYVDPRKGNITYQLRWVPAALLQIGRYRLTNSPTIKTCVPRPHAITVVAVMIETGLRAITARWLDRLHHAKSPIPNPDDPLYSMYVSTDKVNGPWERPTAASVHVMLEEFISVQDQYIDANTGITLDYDNFIHSPFEPINPLFVMPDKNDVLPEHILAKFYRTLMYTFNLYLKAQQIPTVDPLPSELNELKFNQESDFVAAHKHRSDFKTDYTPHGMRATVISSHAPFLPPELIGRKVSGQKAVGSVGYYTKVDAEFLNEVSHLSNAHQHNLLSNINTVFTPDDSTLATWLTDPYDLAKKLHDLGAIALHADAPPTGALINVTEITDLRFDFTHVCKLGQVCTPDIVSTIGAFSCGRCSASIKTIHHLPAITAKCRFLARRIDQTKEQLFNTAKVTDNERVLRKLEIDLENDCAELSAWIASAEVLNTNKAKLEKLSLIYRSEVLSSEIVKVEPASDQLNQLILASIDADQYPEFLDEPLQRKIRELSTRILVYKGDITGVLNIPSDSSLPGYMRGVIGSVCLAANIAVEDLSKLITGEIEADISLHTILKKLGG